MFWNATGEGTSVAGHCACAATTTTRQSAVAAQRHQATQPSGCGRVLACAARPIPAMIRPSMTRGPTYCSTRPFSRARCAASRISSTTRRPAKEQSVWSDLASDRSGQGWPSEAAPEPMLCSRAMRGVRGPAQGHSQACRESGAGQGSGAGSWLAPCVHAKPPPIKVADGASSKPGVQSDRRAQGPPPAIAG